MSDSLADKDWIGLDIGGANIKLATSDRCESLPFELWKYPDDLASCLSSLVPDSGDFRCSVTMTGELADGFSTKREGVGRIVDSVESVFFQSSYYQTDGKFVSASIAKRDWLRTAAANWHATGTWLALKFGLQNAVVVDLGSTTTDLTPIVRSQVVCDATTDLQRLRSNRLIYTGIRRSPICGLMQTAKVGDHEVKLANEFFATIEDAYLVVGKILESANCETADGRPKQIDFAKQRLARMLCSDQSEIGDAEMFAFAQQIIDVQKGMLRRGMDAVLKQFRWSPAECSLVICGEGEWLAAEVFDDFSIERLSNSVDQATADCAPAVAVRELAMRECKHAAGC